MERERLIRDLSNDIGIDEDPTFAGSRFERFEVPEEEPSAPDPSRPWRMTPPKRPPARRNHRRT